MKKIGLLFVISMVAGFLSGCNKFLEEKTDKKLVVPTNLNDLQALLDMYVVVNVSDPGEGEIAADDYYLHESTWAGLWYEYDRRAYTWEPDFGTDQNTWFTTYRNVYYANIILEHLGGFDDMDTQTQGQWNNIAGQAYFMRARGHLVVQLIWALAYDENNAGTDLGVPLRLSSDFNMESYRPSNREVYAQIIEDLEKAIALLPDQPMHVLRASKPAAYALLARTYLFMRDYDKCFRYADSCLQLRNTLMDYNELDAMASFPINEFNVEVLHQSLINGAHQPLQNGFALVDTNLYALYHNNDLRRTIYFQDNENGSHSFKGNYSGLPNYFGGIAIDEVYLMRSECHARAGNLQEAMADLGHLLSHRYKAGTYFPQTVENAEEALNVILEERRKELLFRGLRFPDVKRLNKGGAYIAFERYLEESGVSYTLPPNDPRFALPIAEAVLEREPNIVQNPR